MMMMMIQQVGSLSPLQVLVSKKRRDHWSSILDHQVSIKTRDLNIIITITHRSYPASGKSFSSSSVGEYNKAWWSIIDQLVSIYRLVMISIWWWWWLWGWWWRWWSQYDGDDDDLNMMMMMMTCMRESESFVMMMSSTTWITPLVATCW